MRVEPITTRLCGNIGERTKSGALKATSLCQTRRRSRSHNKLSITVVVVLSRGTRVGPYGACSHSDRTRETLNAEHTSASSDTTPDEAPPCTVEIVLPHVIVVQPHGHGSATSLPRAVGAAVAADGSAAAGGAIEGNVALQRVGLTLQDYLLVVAHEL